MNKKLKIVPELRFPDFSEIGGWKSEPFENVYSFLVTNSFSRAFLNYVNGNVKNIHYGDIHTKFSIQFDITKEEVPFVNTDVSLEKVKDECYCKEGDIVFADASEDLDDVGKSIEIINLNGERVLSGLHTLLARQKGDKLKVGFGGFLFKSPTIRNQIKRESQGAKVLGISGTRLSKIVLVYPTDKQEQQKIASCLSSLDELIAAHMDKLDALKDHKKGLVQNLFPQEGETVSKLSFSENIDWTEKDLRKVVFFQEGPGIMKVDFQNQGVPLVRLSGVGGPTVTLEGCNYLDPHKVQDKWSHFRLEINDLIISTSATFGLSSTVTNAAAGSVFYTGLIRFRPTDECLDRNYLKFFLESPPFERQVELAAVGGGIKHFGPTHLKQMVINFPTSLDEQRKIAYCLSAVDELISAQQEKIEQLQQHKKGLMQGLFP